MDAERGAGARRINNSIREDHIAAPLIDVTVQACDGAIPSP
jgi:hypothetical protein